MLSGAIPADLINHYYLGEVAKEQDTTPEALKAKLHFFPGGDTGGLVNVATDGTRITARILDGGAACPVGGQVTVYVDGPARAFPAQAASTTWVLVDLAA